MILIVFINNACLEDIQECLYYKSEEFVETKPQFNKFKSTTMTKGKMTAYLLQVPIHEFVYWNKKGTN